MLTQEKIHSSLLQKISELEQIERAALKSLNSGSKEERGVNTCLLSMSVNRLCYDVNMRACLSLLV